MMEKASETDDYNYYYYDYNDDYDRQTQNPIVGDYPYAKEFYRCLIILNAQETKDDLLRLSVAKDYFEYAAEICYLGKYSLILEKPYFLAFDNIAVRGSTQFCQIPKLAQDTFRCD